PARFRIAYFLRDYREVFRPTQIGYPRAKIALQQKWHQHSKACSAPLFRRLPATFAGIILPPRRPDGATQIRIPGKHGGLIDTKSGDAPSTVMLGQGTNRFSREDAFALGPAAFRVHVEGFGDGVGLVA